MLYLFESSTCFEQLCAHPQEDNCINTTSGIITLKTSEWFEITRIRRGCNASTTYSCYFSKFRPLTCFQSLLYQKLYSYNCPLEDELRVARNM